MLMSIFGLHAQKTFLQSEWRDSSITIDGSAADWHPPFNYSDSKIKSQLSIRNDSSFLYVCLRTSDQQTQMKITRAGMTVGFDMRGGKKQSSAVGFPLPSSFTMEMPEPGSEEQPKRPDMQKIKMEVLAAMKDMHIQKMLNIPDGDLPLDNPLDIRAAINWDTDNILSYELKIPFGVFYKETITAQDTVKAMSLFITINGINLPAPPAGMDASDGGNSGSPGMGGIGGPPGGGGMGGPPAGGMGGPPGGGMGGAQGGDAGIPPGVSHMMEMSKSQETMFRFKLSYR